MTEYKIVEVLPTVDIDNKGRFIKVYRVTFTYNDIEDWIELPEDQYSEKAVRKAIEAKIKEHKALLGEK